LPGVSFEPGRTCALPCGERELLGDADKHRVIDLMRPRLLLLLLALLSPVLPGSAAAAAATPAISASAVGEHPIGRHAAYLKELDGQLTLDQAVAAYSRGSFLPGRSRVLNFGIGSEPVWIHFGVVNETADALPRRLSIQTAWLDQVDVYFRTRGKTVASFHVGDRLAFDLRPVDSRYFEFDHAFAPGGTDVFVRVETPDPMVVPIYLMSLEQSKALGTQQDYSYGFLYGFLIALAAYNVMLYAGLREPRYILYSLYLAMFLFMNISYTGHGFRWIWPSHTSWEQWSNPVLIVLYGASGLLFALNFLDTRKLFPRIHKAVLGYLGVAGVLLLLAILFQNQRDALLVAFTFVSLFTVIMLAMGVIVVRSGQRPAQYFLLAAFSAMVGAALTAMSVWGFIPFNVWTFRAVDIGVLLDATLLALALTYQFRIGQKERFRAEQLARLDPLTEVNNRRAFYDISAPIWNIAIRHNHDLSVTLLDLDNFKRINDVHGHACGDEVLVAVAGILKKSVRGHDVIARWGGEEFILLLPETDLLEAAGLAERLRVAIADMRLNYAGAEVSVTASFGVAQRQPKHPSLDALISSADDFLYQAKDLGRNRVSHA
jgi:diguanylate cyclase (GGDEF)-like protein